jgi:predicted dithiol-disulfide oxidoreductase (DUF899 family)
MTDHKTGTPQEWLAARLELLEDEKALTRRSDELARRRQELPWVRIDKEYSFMFGPDYQAGCPSCSAIADGFDGSVVHLAHHDVTLHVVSRAPLAKLQSYKRRMGWGFPWASSFDSDFSYDFHTAYTKEQWESGAVESNFRKADFRPSAGEDGSGLDDFASSVVGTDWETFRREGPGVSSFVLEDGVVHHTYSAYERGLDGLWGMYQWLDRAPLGRNESGFWWRRHDEYDS